MPRKEKVPTHKCIVQCVSVTPTGRCRVGRHWPLGSTEAELTDEQIETLKKDISYEFAPGKRADKESAIKRVNFVVAVVEKNVGEAEVVRPDPTPALEQHPAHYTVTEAQLIARSALDRVDALAKTLEAERVARAAAESRNEELSRNLSKLLENPALSALLAPVAPKAEEERLPAIPTLEELSAPPASPSKPKGK